VSALLLLAGAFGASAQVQELSGRTESGHAQAFRLAQLPAGATLYVRAENRKGSLDPFVVLVDASRDPRQLREELRAAIGAATAAGQDPLAALATFADQHFDAWSDDFGGTRSAAFAFRLRHAGDYLLVVAASPAAPSFGEFRLLVGLDAPEVLEGRARPIGRRFVEAEPDLLDSPRRVEVREGRLSSARPTTYFELEPLRAGRTLYATVEGRDGAVSPTLLLQDQGGKPLRYGVAAADGDRVGLQHRVATSGESLRLMVVARPDTKPGAYRLRVGIEAPDTLEGSPAPEGRPLLRPPLVAQVGIRLQQITGVDQRNESFGVVASLRLEWRDPSLAFDAGECHCSFRTFRGEAFVRFADEQRFHWPEFVIFNQQGNRWPQERVVVVFPEGRAVYFERFSATLQAPDFDFRPFPFDRQVFFIRVDSLYPEELVVFQPDNAFTGLGRQLGEEEWRVEDFSTQITSESDITLSTTSRFSYRFEAVRHLAYYTFRIFIPVGIILAVSWVVFFLRDYGKRIEVASGNLLVFVAFNFTVSNDLPRLGYLTFLDTILVSAFVVTSLVVVLNVFLKWNEITGKASLALWLDRYVLWLYPAAYAGAFAIVTLFFT